MSTVFSELDEIAAFEARSQSRLVERILTLLGTAILGVLLVPLISGRERAADNLDIPSIIVFYVMLGVCAYVNRRYGPRTSIHLLMNIGAVVTFSAAIPDTPLSQDSFILGVLAALVIIATIFLSLRTVIVYAVGYGVGILVFAHIAPFVRPINIINGIWMLHIVLCALVLLLAHQRRQLEMARSARLISSELRMRTITETMRDAIFMTDTERRLIYATPSACELFGLARENLDRASLDGWLENVHPEDREELESQVIRLKETHSGQPYQYRYIPPGKSSIWVETISSLVRDAERIPTGLIFVSRNITERKKTEAQRLDMGIQRERFQLFQRFVNDVSHDLRTPLAVMSTSLYLLRKKLPTENASLVASHLESIQNQITHLEKQLENLTTLSRLQNSDARYHFEAKPLNAPLKLLANEFAERLELRKLTLELALTDAPVRVMISEQEFMQALRQIMTNALQYTPEGGLVSIRSSLHDNQALIEVSDTGKGIDSRDLDHIFEPLYRVDKARNIENGGMGLGLSVTRMIIEAHSGTISVSSEVGSGTTFALRIPALLEPAQFYTPASAN